MISTQFTIDLLDVLQKHVHNGVDGRVLFKQMAQVAAFFVKVYCESNGIKDPESVMETYVDYFAYYEPQEVEKTVNIKEYDFLRDWIRKGEVK
jgi:hypothetical protein